MMTMATRKEEKGTHSQLIASAAFLANGWQVAEPLVPEAFDYLVKAPDSAAWETAQVKTARWRESRNSWVISGTRSNGEAYQPEDVRYMVGVCGDGKVFVFECTGYKEYWASPDKTSKWLTVTTEFNE
jgi:hypothetical protein